MQDEIHLQFTALVSSLPEVPYLLTLSAFSYLDSVSDSAKD